MNSYAIRAIYRSRWRAGSARWCRASLSPVISTSLYFVVFGSAIGSRMAQIDGVSYGAFIVPGLIMLSVLTESISNASFGIYMPRWSGTIYEVLSAPISSIEIVIGYVGAAATKSIMLGLIILATARLFVPFQHRASALDGRVPGADLGHLQPVRLHHRASGRAAGRSCRSCRS